MISACEMQYGVNTLAIYILNNYVIYNQTTR